VLTATAELLQRARAGQYALGAFNIYNLEGALAVVRTAETMQSPVILQFLPSALKLAGRPLIAMCLAMAEEAEVEVAVHLDHCDTEETLALALGWGCLSVMADGSALPYGDNLRFTRKIVELAQSAGRGVEGELGLLSGDEDGASLSLGEPGLTDPEQAADFVAATGVDTLAVCIGNVHGHYRQPPLLDFSRLAEIALRVEVPLVLHGTSGLPQAMIGQAIAHGVCKFNVNTEVRSAYLRGIGDYLGQCASAELLIAMRWGIEAMQKPIAEKIRQFRSVGKSQQKA